MNFATLQAFLTPYFESYASTGISDSADKISTAYHLSNIGQTTTPFGAPLINADKSILKIFLELGLNINYYGGVIKSRTSAIIGYALGAVDAFNSGAKEQINIYKKGAMDQINSIVSSLPAPLAFIGPIINALIDQIFQTILTSVGTVASTVISLIKKLQGIIDSIDVQTIAYTTMATGFSLYWLTAQFAPMPPMPPCIAPSPGVQLLFPGTPIPLNSDLKNTFAGSQAAADAVRKLYNASISHQFTIFGIYLGLIPTPLGPFGPVPIPWFTLLNIPIPGIGTGNQTSGTGNNTNTSSNSDTGGTSETGNNNQTGGSTETDTGSESNQNNQNENDSNTAVDTQTQPDTQIGGDTETNTDSNAGTDTDIDTGVGTGTGERTGRDTGSETGSGIGSGTGEETESGMGTDSQGNESTSGTEISGKSNYANVQKDVISAFEKETQVVFDENNSFGLTIDLERRNLALLDVTVFLHESVVKKQNGNDEYQFAITVQLTNLGYDRKFGGAQSSLPLTISNPTGYSFRDEIDSTNSIYNGGTITSPRLRGIDLMKEPYRYRLGQVINEGLRFYVNKWYGGKLPSELKNVHLSMRDDLSDPTLQLSAAKFFPLNKFKSLK